IVNARSPASVCLIVVAFRPRRPEGLHYGWSVVWTFRSANTRGSPFRGESLVNRSSVRRRRLWLLGLVWLLPGLAACGGTSAAPARGRGGEGGAVPLVVTHVTQRDVPVEIDGIGNVEAYSTISVRAQVTGQLTDVRFREGDFVKKG